MQDDEVDARLRRAAEHLFAQAMDYEPMPFGTDYVRVRDVAEQLFREGVVPGTGDTPASAFGIGVLIGLVAAGSS